jgi:prophage regulatory protein
MLSATVHSVRTMPPKRRELRLMGPAEIGRVLGVGRTRVYQITQRRNFPPPVAELEMGNVWLAEDVEEWVAKYRPELAEEPEGD